MAKKQIHFNAFEMNCITHLSPGLWRYPGDEALKYKDIEYWQNIAKIAEKGYLMRFSSLMFWVCMICIIIVVKQP
ncbi:hypothetical protein [Campylobacter lanienae]|uniref:hypothetical protein n=1 Tax=Campylobacter lanienae TaxID=75658 RepID=UPI001F253D19|nr:hypothetical protein [Campylobacter lanienae]